MVSFMIYKYNLENRVFKSNKFLYKLMVIFQKKSIYF